MNVFFDTEIFGLQKRGGASNYWFEFMSRFNKEHNCSFYVLNDEQYLNKDFLVFKEKYNLKTIKDKNYSPSKLRLINPPKPNNKDTIIFHSTVYRYLNKKNVKNIVTLHDFTHQKYMNLYHRFANSFLKKRAIKKADGIICISKNTYNDMLKFYPKAKNKPCAIIYNGFNNDVFHKLDKVVLPKKYETLKDKKIILFVGQREGYKNFKFIIDVIKNTTDIDLVLVGGRDFNHAEYDCADIMHKIHHFNNVNDEELNILYNISFCFIYPSLYEGFGIPICEAMNCECPVIAFNNSSIPEVMNGAGILLENNDLNSTIEELKKLEDTTYRKKIIENQLKACKKFSWDIAYKEMVDFYKKVLNNV